MIYELDSEIVDDIPDDDIPVEELLDKVVSAVKTDSKPKQQILLQAQQILKPGNVQMQSMFIHIPNLYNLKKIFKNVLMIE